ncbi:MAG TPA: 3-deoxy-manno-octulosonate cytidylyltransferase [Rhizomicrobium sp.]|jgi:3-deoxy-manno-octulosonate cytidylyltransferase (CMP-KDO synthetase)|nr:3-deoxy-manno-octulosonate cytidylyltransferase [Rhizomicrobium sp.]
MKSIVVIPARMAATRLPGKPLADIAGMPMILRVWKQALAADVGPVVVAGGDSEIIDVVRAAGGTAVRTDPDLPSGSDRVYAGIESFDFGGAYEAVVNLQGDLPAIDPACIRATVKALEESGADIATAAAPIEDPADFNNPAVVKPIVSWNEAGTMGRALYFTRARAPSGDGPLFHHIGIYAFRRAALAKFVLLKPSALELRERLEQLRALEAGMSIVVARVDEAPLSIDTPDDLAKARKTLGHT